MNLRAITATLYVGYWLIVGAGVLHRNELNTLPLIAAIAGPGVLLGIVWDTWAACGFGLSCLFMLFDPCEPKGSCGSGSEALAAVVVVAVIAATIAIGVVVRRGAKRVRSGTR